MKRPGLAGRVAIALATLAILTAVVSTASAIVSTSSQVRGEVDSFLLERAEEILGGDRQTPDRRDGGDRDRNDDNDNDNEQDNNGGGNEQENDDGDDVAADDTIDAEDAVEDALEQALDESNLPAAADLDAVVQVIDEQGVIIGGTGLRLPVGDADLILAESNREPVFSTVDIEGVEYRVYTAHFDGVGAVQVAQSLDDTTSLLDVIRNRLMLVGAALALVGSGLGWIFARRSLRPLNNLTAAAERVAATQDLDTAIPVDRSDDEIGRLAVSFNEMLDALGASRSQQHRLVQDAAHELRTPLTSVNANVDLLLHARDLPDDERHEILGGIRAELGQLGTLFNEIIELATDKRETSAHEPIRLAGVVQRAVDDLARRAPNPVTVLVDDSQVKGHEASLHRAITNLLSNAVKYSPANSPIEVQVQAGRVSVSDRGAGIPAADRDRVFDRFHRLEEARPLPGSGLGLAIVAKVVSDHRGSTFVRDADPAPGTVVGFTLPLLLNGEVS